ISLSLKALDHEYHNCIQPGSSCVTRMLLDANERLTFGPPSVYRVGSIWQLLQNLKRPFRYGLAFPDQNAATQMPSRRQLLAFEMLPSPLLSRYMVLL